MITRDAADILGRVVRVTIGGQEYVLPVRSIRANREWRATLDARTVGLLSGLDAADGPGAIYAALASRLDDLLDMLLSYDSTGALPTRAAIEEIEPDASMDVLAAVQEVWKASNPLVGTALAAIAEVERASSEPMSTQAPRMASLPPTSMTA